MLRPIVMSAEAGKLNRRKARWSMRKQEVYTWLLNKLNLDIHGYEREGKLEGPCIFTSTVRERASHRDARITASVCAVDDLISVVVISIRFGDGDGWRPRGGPRKSKSDDLDIISGSVLRGSGRYWQLDQQYGDDIGAPGPVNREGAGIAGGGGEIVGCEVGAETAAVVVANRTGVENGVSEFSLVLMRMLAVANRIIDILNCISVMRRVQGGRCMDVGRLEVIKNALINAKAALTSWTCGGDADHAQSSDRLVRLRPAEKVSGSGMQDHLKRRMFVSYRSAGDVELSTAELANIVSVVEQIRTVEALANEASVADDIYCEIAELLDAAEEVYRLVGSDMDFSSSRFRPQAGDERPPHQQGNRI